MQMTDLFQLMLDIYRHYGINVLTLNGIDESLEQIDFGFRKKMAVDFDYHILAPELDQRLRPGTCYLLEDDLQLTYSFFRFSPEQAEEFGCRIICFGPVLFRPINLDSFQDFMKEKGIDPCYQQDFLEFFNHIPIFISYDTWNHMLGYFFEKLCGAPPEFSHLKLGQENSSLRPISPDYSVPEQPDIALTTVEARYRLEHEFMDAVAAGNIADACRAYYSFRQYRLLPRVADPVRNQKNLLFTLNTLLRKAAEAGNVHPLHIDNLSRQLAIQIESSLTVEQLDRLSTNMIRKYCILVNNYSRRAYSSLVRTCMDHIDFHYAAELSLSSLAQICSVSDSYLSTLFKKESGMTITDYINNTRVRQSLILLNTSNLPIGEIASRCGFFDTNYFSRIFKKYQGQSPKQYRDGIRKVAE